MTVHIPVQTPACVVEDSIHGLARSRRRGEQRWSGKIGRIVLGENQVSVAPQYAHVVGVLVEWMLPPALADNAQQYQLARVQMWIAVVGLVWVLE